MRDGIEPSPADDRRHANRVGRLGVALFRRSIHMRRLMPKGCVVADGHQPCVPFSNLIDVRHLDIIVYDPQSMAIRAVCEIKTVTEPARQTFEANGACADVMQRAKAAGIATALGVVRLKRPMPRSVQTPDAMRLYRDYLMNHPGEFSVEYYEDDTFTLSEGRFRIVPRDSGDRLLWD